MENKTFSKMSMEDKEILWKIFSKYSEKEICEILEHFKPSHNFFAAHKENSPVKHNNNANND